MPAGDSYQLQGQDGIEVIDDTSTYTNGGNGYRGFVVLNDAVVATLAGTNFTNASGATGITLAAGLYFPGHITSISLTSGVIAALKR